MTALISTAGTSVEIRGQRRGAGRDELAVAGEVVVVREREQADARLVRLANELGGLEDAVGAGRVGVDVRDRVARDERLGVVGTRGVARGSGRRHPQTSTRRWIRSICSARPVAGSMSTWQALKTTGPSPTSNRVGSALTKRGSTVSGLKPMTLHTGPVMPRSVW